MFMLSSIDLKIVIKNFILLFCKVLGEEKDMKKLITVSAQMISVIFVHLQHYFAITCHL